MSEIPMYPDECPHGGRTASECDACEVERLRAQVEELETQLSSMLSARDLTIRDLREVIRELLADADAACDSGGEYTVNARTGSVWVRLRKALQAR